MAAPFNAWVQPAFDLFHDDALMHPTLPTLIADVVLQSTTRSVYRLHWNTIAIWNDLSARVIQYWNSVPQLDKQTNVITIGEYTGRFNRVGFSRAGNEGDITAIILDFVQPVQSSAANGTNSAPQPSDRHSILQQWTQGVEGNAVAGCPDLVMRSEYGYAPHRVTVMGEVKNPWQVTLAGIDQIVRQGIAYRWIISNLLENNLNNLPQSPPREVLASRLALEQIYGYMVRNGKVYGVLTTMKGWSFLRRENGGLLYITPMFGDFQARQGISHGAAYEGYYVSHGFSIIQALYYLSAMAEATDNLPETPIGGRAGQVTLPYAGNSTTAAPMIQQPPPANPGFELGGLAPAPAQDGQGHQIGYQGVQILGGYDQSGCAHYDEAFNYRDFQFEP